MSDIKDREAITYRYFTDEVLIAAGLPHTLGEEVRRELAKICDKMLGAAIYDSRAAKEGSSLEVRTEIQKGITQDRINGMCQDVVIQVGRGHSLRSLRTACEEMMRSHPLAADL